MKINKERDKEYKQYLLDNYTYDCETGKVYNKKGDELGYICKYTGYLRLHVDKNCMYVHHRVCWLLYYGEFPKDEIDHINHDRADNRICNLRECTQSQNQANSLIRKDSVSGYKNVAWNYQRKKWYVRIQKEGYRKAYAFFDSIDDAIKEAERLRKEIHGEFAHG